MKTALLNIFDRSIYLLASAPGSQRLWEHAAGWSTILYILAYRWDDPIWGPLIGVGVFPLWAIFTAKANAHGLWPLNFAATISHAFNLIKVV